MMKLSDKRMDQKEANSEEFVKKYVRKNKAAYYFWRTLFIVPAHLVYRPRYKGKENIPQEGAVILASNHIHLCDPVFVLLSTKRMVRYLAKRELHDSSLGFLYRAANTIPVDRQHGAHDSVLAAETALQQGEVIGIFPEGTRNKHPEEGLLEFKYGAVKIAQDTGALLVPIGYTSGGRPFLDPYRIVVGEAYSISKDADLEVENEKLRNKIAELLKECETL